MIGLHFAANGIDLSSFKFFWGSVKLFYYCKSDVSNPNSWSLNLAPIESTYVTSY